MKRIMAICVLVIVLLTAVACAPEAPKTTEAPEGAGEQPAEEPSDSGYQAPLSGDAKRKK
ncbi:hypothetical protein HYX14_01890 [Candidatus Woesearchaeota archaeon]|nr:hypothetical protein [Candidatus Woesearchaeota archaeon]